MAFKFEQLRVWQISLEFGEKINSLADEFPRKEMFNLSSQIRRAADSIGLNIAEGSTGHTNAEQKRFRRKKGRAGEYQARPERRQTRNSKTG